MDNSDRMLAALRELLECEYEPSRERSLALTKLDELQLWLTRCARKSTDGGE